MAEDDEDNLIDEIFNALNTNRTTNDDFNKLLKAISEINVTENKDQIINKLPVSKKSSQANAIKNLGDAYKKGNLALVVGAGLSINYGIPGWNSLLQRLLIRTIDEENKRATLLSKVFTKIFNPSPLIAGRYLQESLSKTNSKKNNFESEVREALYQTFEPNHNSLIMDEIIKLCVAPGNSPNLDSIISYNYDDIIETKLKEFGAGLKFKPIYGKGWDPDDISFPIYHVHGFLPKAGKIGEDNNITLGEYIYHEQYNAIYSWNNIVQINKFRDKTCFFIGSSLSDPNIRRLLDIANTQKNNNKYHYIVKIRQDREQILKALNELLSKEPDLYDEKNSSRININDTIELLIKIHDRFEERDSESLGVKTVWIDNFEKDISNILKKIREQNVA